MFGRDAASRTGVDGVDGEAGSAAEGELVLGGLRWPWAALAAVLGAAAGAAVALLVRRQLRADPPDAQEPHELKAVVDRPQDPPA